MKHLVLFIFSLLFIGCTKLAPEIYSDLTSENAYSTESDLLAALTGVYSDLGTGAYQLMITWPLVSDFPTDQGFSWQAGDPTEMTNFTYTGNNHYISESWMYLYRIIKDANTLISKVDGVNIADETKSKIVGQARFLRALAYRRLTDVWGPVPLISEPVSPAKVSDEMPLSPVSEVDKLIIEDCKYAIANLPEVWSDNEVLAKATKGAAATMLARVYMRSHDYTSAKQYIDLVLGLADKGVYRLNPDFKNVWSGSNKYDKEVIFGIVHSKLNNTSLANHFSPEDYVGGRWDYFATSLYFWRKYSDLDPRKDFFYWNYEGISKRENSNNGYLYIVPQTGQNVPPNDTTVLLKDVCTKKFSYELISPLAYRDERTIILMRLSGVVLLKAEIENELNGPAAALPFLNQVRARAGAPIYGGSISGFTVPATKEEMADKILDERGFELVTENKRRSDLIRFGEYVERCNASLTSRGLDPVVTNELIYLPYPEIEALRNNEMAAANRTRTP